MKRHRICLSHQQPTQVIRFEYDLNGCTAQASAQVNVIPAATISVENDTICEGQVGVLTATTSGDPANITWSPGGFTGPTISVSPSSTTTYTATITSGTCTNSASADVVVIDLPTATVSNTHLTVKEKRLCWM